MLRNLIKISEVIRPTIKKKKMKKVKENIETKVCEIKEEENDDKEMKSEPIAQQYRSVQTKAKKSVDNKQSHALFKTIVVKFSRCR